MNRTTRLGVGLSALLWLAACSEPTAMRSRDDSAVAGSGVTPSGQQALDPVKMARLERYDDGGCAFTAPDDAGHTRGFAVHRQNLPFDIHPVTHDPKTGQGNGRFVKMTLHGPDGRPLTLACIVPNDQSLTNLSASTAKSKSGRWSGLFKQIKNARLIPDSVASATQSPEATAFESATLARPTRPAAKLSSTVFDTDPGCVQVHGEFSWYWDEGDEWFTVEVDFTDCNPDDGGGDVFVWLATNGYDTPPHVVLDANVYQVVDPDSVTFTAEVVSDTHLPPVGWTWTVGGSAATDPWTIACAGTGTTCRIQVHGTGFMSYTVQDGSGHDLTDTLEIVGISPPDVDSLAVGGGDTDDAGSPGATFATNAISAATGSSILSNALGQPDWVYTQGCAQCGALPHAHTEPAKNLASHEGDCTDFVWSVVRSVLGSTTWPFTQIARTTTFGRMTSANAGYWGYVLTDSAHVREGDVVVRVHVVGTDTLGGHAGIFDHWEKGGNAIGWANNGIPATATSDNIDFPTGKFNFKPKTGWITRFFRPATP